MHTGISHLSFSTLDEALLTELVELGLSNFEIVLSKLRVSDLGDFCKVLKRVGLSSKSAQSILFNSGVGDLTDQAFIEYLDSTIPVYKAIGVTTLVLGSPAQRNVLNFEKLGESFSSLDRILSDSGMTLCIEPNSQIYGGRYFFDVESIVEFIELHNFSNVKTMIDTHNLILEGLNPATELLNHFRHIHHVHISEAGLTGFAESEFHRAFSNALKSTQYSGLITYETLNSKNLIDEVTRFTKYFS
jgi:sugar phosphate isomerase/epimerase